MIALSDLTPKPCCFSSMDIATLGEETRRELDISSLKDLEDAIRNIGGGVRRSHNSQFKLVVLAPRNFMIYVDEEEGTFSSRFLIAMCLGHYTLHYPLLDSEVMLVQKNLQGLSAEEAYSFARAFLMPAGIMREAFKRHHGVDVDIAQQLGLETPLVRRRIKELGIKR